MPENPNKNESSSADAQTGENDLCERVQRLREKTERLSETLDEVKATLSEAAEPQA
jgi:chaperonin cofactor prefoldin